MYENFEAIVLRKYRYSESSYILHLFTRGAGRINALAKGARRDKSPMKGHFDLFNLEEVTVFRKRRSDLDLATGANLLQEYRTVRNSPVLFACVNVVAEVILKSCMLSDKHELAFDALNQLLVSSEGIGAKPASLLVRALWLVLRDLGFEPVTDSCVVCGKSDLVKFVISPADGGIVCADCGRSAKYAVLDQGDLAGIRRIASHDSQVKVDFYKNDILRALEDYLNYVLGFSGRSFGVLFGLLGEKNIASC